MAEYVVTRLRADVHAELQRRAAVATLEADRKVSISEVVARLLARDKMEARP